MLVLQSDHMLAMSEVGVSLSLPDSDPMRAGPSVSLPPTQCPHPQQGPGTGRGWTLSEDLGSGSTATP